MTIIGIAMVLPLLFSIIYREPCTGAFALSIVISTLLGLLLWRFVPAGAGGISRRDAIILVAGSWIMMSFFGAMPYFFSGTFPSFIDALFESVSGLTTSGSSILTDIEIYPKGILLWRSFSQWLGGMGIITLFVALFPMLGIGAARMVEAEMPGPQSDRLTPRIRDTAKSVWLLYLGFSGLELILLLFGGMPFFDALTVTFSTMATGGFCPRNASIAYYNSPFIEGVIIAFMILAGVNFGLYYFLLWKRQPWRLLKEPEFRFYIIMVFGSSFLIILNLIAEMGLPAGLAIRHGLFNTVSMVTTTGFATTDFNTWPEFSRAILLFLVIIGGSAGSTSGGLKVVRLLVLLKYVYRRFKLIINPNAVIPLKIGGNSVSENALSGILGVSILYVLTLAVLSLILNAMGIDIVTAVSAIAANMATTGPGLGMVGPATNYFWMPAAGKITVMIAMLVGRLELFTVFVIFSPSFWKWR